MLLQFLPHFPRIRVRVLCSAAAWLLGAKVAGAAVILLDFNEANGTGGPGGVWNTFNAPANVNGGTVNDSAGAATGVTILLSGTATDGTNNGTTLAFDNNQIGVAGLPSWATSTTDNRATGDFFYTANSATATPQSFTLTFGGLIAGNVVNMDLLASRASASGVGFYEYSLNGGANWSGFRVLNGDGTPATANGWDTLTTFNGAGGQVFEDNRDGYTNHRYLNASDVTLTGNTLQVRVTDKDAVTATFAVLNAMRLTVVPEPASTGLLALGVVFLGSARRRCRGQR